MFTTRLISGAVLVALTLLLGILGGPVLAIVNGVIAVIGMFELYRAFGIENERTALIGYLGAAVLYIFLIAGRRDLVLMAVILTFLCMMALMRLTAAQVELLSGGQGIIDLTFAVTPSRISAALSRYGRTAAAFYQWGFYAVDMFYALAYGTFYRCAIKSVAERCDMRGAAAEILPMLPVAAVTADLLENTMMFFLLAGSRSGVLMWSFTVFNVIKFAAVYSSLAIVVGGAVWLLKKRLS